VALNQPLDEETAQAIVRFFHRNVIAGCVGVPPKRCLRTKNLRLLITGSLPDLRLRHHLPSGCGEACWRCRMGDTGMSGWIITEGWRAWPLTEGPNVRSAVRLEGRQASNLTPLFM
jgi:hypothetical protein